jgi:hypothetical protein
MIRAVTFTPPVWCWRSTLVRYEGEHLVLYYNDRALYEKTADHSKGGGHPILQ